MQTDRARAITTARARPPQRSGRRLKPYLYVLPAALAYIGFSVWPALNTVFYSLTEWDGLNPAVWTGVGNYVDVFTDPALYGSVLHSIVLILFFAVLPISV